MEPLSSLRPPKLAGLEMRVIESMAESICSWLAARSSAELAPVLAASRMRDLIEPRRSETSERAAAVVGRAEEGWPGGWRRGRAGGARRRDAGGLGLGRSRGDGATDDVEVPVLDAAVELCRLLVLAFDRLVDLFAVYGDSCWGGDPEPHFVTPDVDDG